MTILCRLADLEAAGAKDVMVEDAGLRRATFVVNYEGTVAAFRVRVEDDSVMCAEPDYIGENAIAGA